MLPVQTNTTRNGAEASKFRVISPFCPPACPGALPRATQRFAQPLPIRARASQSTDRTGRKEVVFSRCQGGAVPAPVYPRSPPPERDYDASDAWIADLVTAALTLLRAVAAEAESTATALAALDRRVSWEGPAAREFRRRAGALWAGGSSSATALDTLADDVRALRTRLWMLTQDASHGG